jgi:hypothetical protein
MTEKELKAEATAMRRELMELKQPVAPCEGHLS